MNTPTYRKNRDFVEICRLLDLTYTDEQLFAAQMLEARGQTFCVHFGLDNCEEKWATILTNAFNTFEGNYVQ